MPNLNQSYFLKERYFHLDVEDIKIKKFIDSEPNKDTIIKAFRGGVLRENINEPKFNHYINESFNPPKPAIIKYFEESKEELVVLLFIDISEFSKTIKDFTSAEVKLYLDEYYKDIIPIIYANGGEIEKLMGDGIICVFGKPFLDLKYPRNVYKAEKCAWQCVKKFQATNKNVKIAIHIGNVIYYKIPSDDYGEYTMIGQPITDLYRLESVSEKNSINFYSDSLYDFLGWKHSIFDTDVIKGFAEKPVELQGVHYLNRKKFRF
ncbi:MAG: adenylate/guanylate cyclase domain-containing protein [Sphingobacteriales bacterium JAD_PAG50586_3]|nr:MAG: adenylate/guanylate cyclase domain-containing protein [Sphingobacteriales bacterium JAD_PAG50586_3]